MSYLAAPPETPIDIDAAIAYNYVIAQQGALSITATADADFTFRVQMGEPAMLTLTYSGTIPTVAIFKTVNLVINWKDGTSSTHSPQFRVLPQPPATRMIPNISLAKSVTVAAGQNIDVTITTDIAVDGFGATNLPAGLVMNTTTGRITGPAPSVSGFYVVTLQANLATNHYKRYWLVVVGTGTTPPSIPPGTRTSSPRIFYDGDFTVAQLAGPPEYEAPFANDPKPYLYKLKYWQFFDNFSEPTLGSAGPLGGIYCGGSPGTIKQIGGGVIEFERQFALIPDSRSEFETHVYSYQIILVGAQGGVVELPTNTHSRIQFDYFQTNDPGTIDIPKAPRAVQILDLIFPLHDFLTVQYLPSGAEVLAEDSTYKIWKPGIYERRMRFIQWLSYTELVAGSF